MVRTIIFIMMLMITRAHNLSAITQEIQKNNKTFLVEIADALSNNLESVDVDKGDNLSQLDCMRVITLKGVKDYDLTFEIWNEIGGVKVIRQQTYLKEEGVWKGIGSTHKVSVTSHFTSFKIVINECGECTIYNEYNNIIGRLEVPGADKLMCNQQRYRTDVPQSSDGRCSE